jgi:hypothetical protein
LFVLDVSGDSCDVEAVSTAALGAVSPSTVTPSDAVSCGAVWWSGALFHAWTAPLPIVMKTVAVNARTNAATPNTRRHDPGSCRESTTADWVSHSRLGGVVVSVIATGPNGCGFEPGQGDGFLRAIKIRNTRSSRMGSKAGRSHVLRFYVMLKNS